MDLWLYYDVTHRTHRYCNPLPVEGLEEMAAALDLAPGRRVLDIACGHAEILATWVDRYGVLGTGVDLSPYAFRRAETRRAACDHPDRLDLLHMRGEDYAVPEEQERFDVSMCLGASWIWNGWEGTLRALQGFTKPGGLVVAGEPYWRQEPPVTYLQAEELTRDMFPTLAGYHEGVRALGAELVWMRGASEADWDRYEMQQAAALDAFARAEPDHPDLDALRAKRRLHDATYMQAGRACLGFAVWVWRMPAA